MRGQVGKKKLGDNVTKEKEHYGTLAKYTLGWKKLQNSSYIVKFQISIFNHFRGICAIKAMHLMHLVHHAPRT